MKYVLTMILLFALLILNFSMCFFRSMSPMKILDFKMDFRNDAYDDERNRKYPCMQDVECIKIKEERLSDGSVDSYGNLLLDTILNRTFFI